MVWLRRPVITAPPPPAVPPASLFGFCYYFLAEHRTIFLWLFLCGLGVACADALVAVFIGKMVGFVGQADRWAAWHERWPVLLILLLVIGLVRPFVIWIDLRLRNAFLIPGVTSRMRWISYWRVTRQSWSFFQGDSPGRLAHWVMQTPGALREVAEATIRAVWYLSMYGLMSMVLLGSADWRLTLPVLAWFAGFALLLRAFVPRLRSRADENAERYSRLMAELVDAYGNILTVKLFGVAATVDGPVRKALLAHDDAQARHMEIVTGFMTRLTLLNTMLLLGTAAIGAFLWLHQAISAEAVAMALPLVWQVANTGGWVAWEVAGIYQNLGEIRQGMSVIAAPNDRTDDDAAPSLEAKRGRVAFDRISFGYANRPPVFQNFSLDIAPGEKLGIVGRSGAGKSTLVALLLRLVDIQSGTIRIDGQDIQTVSAESLRARIGVVTQDVSLFHRSIRDNLLCGKPDASDAELLDALDRAQASAFVAAIKDEDGHGGLDAIVGERGGKLSGGQRQRLMLVRALIKDVPIVILDEATSALDSEAEQAIGAELDTLLADKTVISIAHRLSALVRMDRILVIDEGRVIEQGTHSGLLSQNGLYARLWRQQTAMSHDDVTLSPIN
ncbi:ABC transporter ATP-binding protein [Tardiphaga alba]|uniref:ABC transporter ATP-binding protein n=1 Tax=Tardiphaga alba TaxID=340268 RepID=A0ABX8A633_9BRAD|nr:ABC transporter ATP-binding protein [Tardiphaga alba]